jgi:CHAT domain-containing protein
MWSIDSTLRYMPIAALHDGKQYLVQRFRNSLITPGSISTLTDAPAGVWQGEGFGVSEAKAGFRALPSVPQELHGIFGQAASGTAPLTGAIRLNAEFTRTSFENDLRSRRHPVVHIATHFDSRPGVAANSHLLLGDGSEWSLADIASHQDLFAGVDLLTLSACSTAFTNRNEDGREVDSFGALAEESGAKGVIASLWSVNDEATARLMEAMYRLWKEHPELGKSEALRQAQEQMVTGSLRPGAGAGKAGRGLDTGNGVAPHDWSHPFYWAPFILIGNWK